MKKFDTEQEFGTALVQSLRLFGFETWQEVSVGGGTPDLIACKDYNYYCLELKLALNDTVIEQIWERSNMLKNCFCCAVIPYFHSKKYFNISRVKSYYLTKFNLGLWLYDPTVEDLTINHFHETDDFGNSFRINECHKGYGKTVIKEEIQPKLSNGKNDVKKYLFDDQKECIAGSTSGGVITPFKRSCIIIKEYLIKNGKITRKQLWTDLKNQLHWSSYNSMCSALNNLNYLDAIKEINELL